MIAPMLCMRGECAVLLGGCSLDLEIEQMLAYVCICLRKNSRESQTLKATGVRLEFLILSDCDTSVVNGPVVLSDLPCAAWQSTYG